MKKYLIIILSCFIILSILYFIEKKDTKDIEYERPKIEEKEEEVKYVDENQIILGLYKYYGSNQNRKLIKEFSNRWTYHNDISSFEVYYINEEEIPGSNQIDTFNIYKTKYENVDNYKIGYIISFKTNDKEINKTIYRPSDVEEFYNYLEIYLYDDYHRTGGWYSHTTDEEYNDNTLLTSIKLTAGKDIDNITSDIKLIAFTYDKEKDIDSLGNYLGNSKYEIIVKKSN